MRKQKQIVEKDLKSIFEDVLRVSQELEKRNFWLTQEEFAQYIEVLKSLVKVLFSKVPVRISSCRACRTTSRIKAAYELWAKGKTRLSSKSRLTMKVSLKWGELQFTGVFETTDSKGIPDRDFYEWKVKTYEDLMKISNFVEQLKIKCSFLD